MKMICKKINSTCLFRVVIIATLLTPLGSFAQQNLPGKTAVLKAIKHTSAYRIEKYNTQNGNNEGGEWSANNTDSIFYKNDTVRFYNCSISRYAGNHTCNFKTWILGRSNKFTAINENLCTEPPINRAEYPYTILVSEKALPKYIPVSPVNYNVFEKDGTTYVITCAGKKVFAKYKVIELNQYKTDDCGENSFELVLVRQKKKVSHK